MTTSTERAAPRATLVVFEGIDGINQDRRGGQRIAME